MSIFKEFIILDKTSDIAVYLQITNAIIHNIRRGRLRRGLKLPGSRELALELAIHRKTVVAAYDELLAQGWIEMISRRGTFVVQNLPEIKPMKITQEKKLTDYVEKTAFQIEEKNFVSFPTIDFPDSKNLIINSGFPDIRLTPIKLFLRELRSLSKQAAFKKYFMYGSAQGTMYLREILAAFLSDTRGLPISLRNILITNGAQMGIYLATNLLLKPGDIAVVGEPGYFGANLTFQQVGAAIHKVPVDAYGIDVDAIERLCIKKKIRMVYVIPHHHHPTTVTLIPERRIRLLELAARYKFAIVEDDYDYDFHYTSSPVLPMASLDQHGNVIYVGTLSKTLAPAIRLGFVVAPENFIQAASHLRRSIDWQGDSLIEIAIAELYRNGTMSRHIKKAVKTYHERRDSFCSLLQNHLGNFVSFKVPDGGMAVWTNFQDVNLIELAERVAKKGLVMTNGSLYNSTHSYNSTGLGFASLNIQEQERAVEIIRKSI